MIYKHKKTGKIYRHLATAVDCTNSRDGTLVIVYCPDDDEHTIYVREEKEFLEKFELFVQEPIHERAIKDCRNFSQTDDFKKYSESYRIGYEEALDDVEAFIHEETGSN